LTEILCYENSYLKEFDATVTQATETGVALDQTAFYPGGGGQPSDTGFIIWEEGGASVQKLSKANGTLIHKLDGPIPTVGTKIHGSLDWDKRYQLMRTHTALHILCGVVWRDYGALVTGGNMTPLSARMDFELENMSSEFAMEMEELVNKEIEEERDIVVDSLSREEAFKIPDLIRLKINKLPPAIKKIRTVDIVGLDLQADGGTHVSNTREVGHIQVVGHESKGRINKRLRIGLSP
tara:strand:- start:2085 stop:2795 length:711 start_codon:yes stop_codon:yes gene_type:complete